MRHTAMTEHPNPLHAPGHCPRPAIIILHAGDASHASPRATNVCDYLEKNPRGRLVDAFLEPRISWDGGAGGYADGCMCVCVSLCRSSEKGITFPADVGLIGLAGFITLILSIFARQGFDIRDRYEGSMPF